MKAIKISSWILGVTMFSFGILKFVDPFKSWYTAQITYSGMSSIMYWLGQIGEIITGILFIYLILNHKYLAGRSFKWLMRLANLGVIIMMLTAFYVHLHPNVPADVLPLKISPPVIPGFFMLIAIYNIISVNKISGKKQNS